MEVDGGTPSIIFRGVIDHASVAKLADILKRFPKQPGSEEGPFIRLSSPGGDVDAALAGGRAIRKALGVVYVDSDLSIGPTTPSCASACVFLYAGAVRRFEAGGGVAIHNPYVASATATYDDVRAARARMERDIRAFLAEMNVSSLLFERMQAIPSNQQRRLTAEELDELGLGMSDPAYLDYRLGQLAAKYGVSKATYLARFNTIQAKCGKPPRSPSSPPTTTATRQMIQEYFDRLADYRRREPELLAKWQACQEEVLAGRR
jgi:hypothetical protein